MFYALRTYVLYECTSQQKGRKGTNGLIDRAYGFAAVIYRIMGRVPIIHTCIMVLVYKGGKIPAYPQQLLMYWYCSRYYELRIHKNSCNLYGIESP